MKQLYTLGILVAIMLLVLLGLNKISNAPKTVSKDVSETVTTTEEADITTNEQQNQVYMEQKLGTEENTTVVMKTNFGDITIELFTKDMPITAGNFLELASNDYYDGIKFHRVINRFMIQGGDPLTKDDSQMNRWGTGGPGYAIQDEFVPGFSNLRGTLSMANSGPNTSGSQFFINLVDNVNLDFDKQPLTSKHPVFGRVVSGMEVVDAIGSTPTGARDVPTNAVIINDIVVEL